MMKKSAQLKYLMIIAIILLINVIGSFIYGYIDLTEDKRFSLTEPTKELLENVDDVIFIKVYLEGEFPSGFKRLKEATRDLLGEFNGRNSNIQYVFEDPSEGTPDEVNQSHQLLAEQGLRPTTLTVFDGQESTKKTIFPYAIMQFGQRKVVVNLLEEQVPGQDEEVTLNNAVSLLEYKFANGLQKIQLQDKQNIVFSSGQGEILPQNTFMLERELRKYYNTGRIVLDSVLVLDSAINLLVVAAPLKEMSLQNQFKIDQYLMNGGKILWMIEKLATSVDSIGKYNFYIPQEINNNLDNLLFRYGVRIQPDLVMDLESSSIAQIVGYSGGKPQTAMFPWPYHLLVTSKSHHPIVKNIDRVNLTFPSSIDTLPTPGIRKTVLLESSAYSRKQMSPMRLNFEMLKTEPDPQMYNQGNQPLAVLLEGRFPSFFKNRVTSSFQNTLDQLNMKFVDLSRETKQIVISDADFATNLINNRTQEPEELGFNKWERKYFKGNKDFIFNAIEYLLDDAQILSARSKEIKLRLLDGVKTKTEKRKWQAINMILPLIFLAIFGFAFNFYRRRKYST